MPIDHKNVTDPTYLRSIYDGLILGSLNKDNTAALPIGLLGTYEEALPPASNVNERKKFLEFFGVWAILKKEVSVSFVLPLLEGWAEQDLLDYLAKYSKWFNSPVPGKLILYHERFRAFLLQKISHDKFIEFNALIIKNAQDAIETKQGDGWEFYALEHLSTHLLIAAMETGDANDFKKQAYNSTLWNRQVEMSKGYEWSKGLLNDLLLWASQYDNKEVIDCALNKVDLYHMEQNDAPRIIELVAKNDIETALAGIEAFGGNDKEGLQRKFILYMLCLMELTLLESKDKAFRKEAIEKLLKHLDDNLPVDRNVLNWNDFFPSHLVFRLLCALEELNIDGMLIMQRTNNWETDWITNTTLFSENELLVIRKCYHLLDERHDDIGIEDEAPNVDLIVNYNEINKSKANRGGDEITRSFEEKTNGVLAEIDNQNSAVSFNNLIEKIEALTFPVDKCKCYIKLSNGLLNAGNGDLLKEVIQKAQVLASGIQQDYIRLNLLFQISYLQIKIGNELEGRQMQELTVQEALNIDKIGKKNVAVRNILNVKSINNDYDQMSVMVLSYLNQKKGLQNSEGVVDARYGALKEIISVYAEKGEIKICDHLLNLISDKNWKDLAISHIAYGLAVNGNLELAAKYISSIKRSNVRPDMTWLLIKNLKENGNEAFIEPLVELLGEDFKYNKSEIDLKLAEYQNSLKKANSPESKDSTQEIAFNITNVNLDNTVNAVLKNKLSVSLIEKVLQMYSLNQLYFSNLNDEKLKRYNYTLNLQWAIDIKNTFIENK